MNNKNKNKNGDLIDLTPDISVCPKCLKVEVPSKVGYTVTWPKTITFSFDTDSPMKVGPTSVANKYIITYHIYP